MPITAVIILGFIVLLILVVASALIRVVPLILFLLLIGFVLLLVGDKAAGGTAIDQLGVRIAMWLKSHGIGG